MRMYGGRGYEPSNGLAGLCSLASQLCPFCFTSFFSACSDRSALGCAQPCEYGIPIREAEVYSCAPAMAYLLWRRGDTVTAVVALIWPVLGPMVAQWILIIPTAFLELTVLGNAAQIGPVQMRFLAAIGFRPT